MKPRQILLLGALATVGVAELWHGPLGSASDLERSIETRANTALANFGVPEIKASLAEKPLRRTLVLYGPADDFQRRALVETMGKLPGVNEVRWDPRSPLVDHFAASRARRQRGEQR